MSLAFIFPGQGSQSLGMLGNISENNSDYGEIVSSAFEEASDALGFDLWDITQNGPEQELNKTEFTQPAMLTAAVAIWRIWNSRSGAVPVLMAGHSLGEYSALVCAGSLAFTDAVKLVNARGRYMQSAVADGEGAMAAILGLADDILVKLCQQVEANTSRLVSAVNFNSPGQVVIAGYADAVEQVMLLAKENGAKRALKLPVSVPSHCRLMAPAVDKLAADIAGVTFNRPQIPVINNVNVAIETDAEKIKTALLEQLTHPVRWVETIQNMKQQDVSQIIECGPGKVLTGLSKRIDKSIAASCIFDDKTIDTMLMECA